MKKQSVGVNLKVSGIEGIHFMNRPDIKIKGGETKSFIVYIATPSSAITNNTHSSPLITFSAEIINQSVSDLSQKEPLILNKTVAFLLPVKEKG